MTVHVTGPAENANEMMKTTSAPSVISARRASEAALRPRSPKREADHGEAERHADEARDQERAPAEAIDEGDRDEGREHVDRADPPGGGLGLLRGRRIARGGEDAVRVIDDGVDAGELLQDGKPKADHQRRSPAPCKDLTPGRRFDLSAQRLRDRREPRLGVMLRAESDERAQSVFAAPNLGEPARRFQRRSERRARGGRRGPLRLPASCASPRRRRAPG